MANTNPITKWLISRKEFFNLSFTQYGWPERYLPGLYDFTAQISLNGISSQGRGTDFIAVVAIEKASAEAIERYLCKVLKMDSVGFSVSGFVSATEHAKFEALERYYLNRHLSLNISFRRISESAIEPGLMQIISQLEDNSPSTFVSFHQMHTSINEYGVVCFIEDTKLNVFSFGFAFSKSLGHSLKRSFIEAIPNFAALKEKETTPSLANPLPTVLQENKPWHLSPSFHSQMLPLIFDGSDLLNPKLEPENLEDLEIETLQVSLNAIPELNDCPIEPVKITIKKKEAPK